MFFGHHRRKGFSLPSKGIFQVFIRILISVYKIGTVDSPGIVVLERIVVQHMMVLWCVSRILTFDHPGCCGNQFGHQEAILLVHLCLLDSFILGSSILEPNLDLGFG